jgi:hypothetical protein
MKITITTAHSASRCGIPVCLIDGELVPAGPGMLAAIKALGWDRYELADKCGKSRASIDRYAVGLAPVPAEVWNVLKDALEAKAKA